MLNIKNFKTQRNNKEILKGLNLEVNPGEVHILMGPNGSGKSTLALGLMGHPDVIVSEESNVSIDGKDLLSLEVNERAKAGLFLAFQYPLEVPGVSFSEFLRLSYNNIQTYKLGEKYRPLSPFKFKTHITEKMNDLKMEISFLERNLNEGFSGGEKKKAEILQMAVLEPKYAILDETDSGLDVSALKDVFKNTSEIAKKLHIGLIVITHYGRVLNYLKPDYVHVLFDGKIVKTGGEEIPQLLDEKGYEYFINFADV
jgi:Fe-S cluster assembly ATP-binding protein